VTLVDADQTVTTTVVFANPTPSQSPSQSSSPSVSQAVSSTQTASQSSSGSQSSASSQTSAATQASSQSASPSGSQSAGSSQSASVSGSQSQAPAVDDSACDSNECAEDIGAECVAHANRTYYCDCSAVELDTDNPNLVAGGKTCDDVIDTKVCI
jgi:hypothetical protein